MKRCEIRFLIMFLAWIVMGVACYRRHVEIQQMQSECIRLGYGEYVDGKFVLKEQK